MSITKRNYFITVLVLILCFTATMAVYASEDFIDYASSDPAGISGTIRGISQDGPDDTVYTSTTVTFNPDDAYLRNSMQLNTQEKTAVARSEDGVRSFSYSFVFFYELDNEPTLAYCAHEVVGPDNSYGTYTATSLTLDS